MGIKERLIAEHRAKTGKSYADAKRDVEARVSRGASHLADAQPQPRVLHLDQILTAVRALPHWLHWMRHRGIPARFEVPVNSWTDIDTTIPPNGVPRESVPERVAFNRDRGGNWRFDGRVAVIDKELPLDTMPADEAIRHYARRRLDPIAYDGIVRITAVPQPINEHRNIPIDLAFELLGPTDRSVLGRDHHNARLIEFDGEIECVSAHPVAFEEPQPQLLERGGVLYVDHDARAGETPEPYDQQKRRKLRDCKPGETVFARINGGGPTWHPLRVAFGAPSP